MGHDRRSCKDPAPIKFSKGPEFDPWLHYEWEEHYEAMKIVRENPDGMTLEQIGEILGITRERVRQIEAAAINKLRTKEGLNDVVEFGNFVFAILKCERCGEEFVRDGPKYLCDKCEPDPIPQEMPIYTVKVLKKTRKRRSRSDFNNILTEIIDFFGDNSDDE
jgi:hypothetical protein